MEPGERFERLGPGVAGGTKLCGRRVVNPSLSVAEAMDVERFLRALRKRFGEPDHIGDEHYSYSIQDRDTGLTFEAYAAQSGPAYGGGVPYFDKLEPARGWLRQDVFAMLASFDAWVEAALFAAD